jgi:hypothetical protein
LFSFSAQAQLPVNLKTFKARSINLHKTEIFWTTEYEKNNLFFDIERSVDGVNYTSTGKVAGRNLNGTLTDYFFYDNNAIKGISYYRLKQVDVDGSFMYSHIEKVSNSGTVAFMNIYPNPVATGVIKIDLLMNVPDKIEVLIFDMTGRLLLQEPYSNGRNISIDYHLPAGKYLVNIHGKDVSETKSLLIR